jgi:DNA invertase Pin-like site-specific DNA recombinase
MVNGSTSTPPGAATDQFDNANLVAARPPRRRPRLRDGARGLPSEEDRIKLAKAYLVTQHLLWPSLAKTVLLPSPEDAAALKAMANDLARRHMAAEVSEQGSLNAIIRAVRLAAAYLRYSCDNSSPRSLDDQLVNVLNKAVQENLFVPWQMIYADASITGLDASRRGYRSLKTALQESRYASAVDAVIIDEFSRASRDTFEWFRLSSLCKRLHKNVLGASDGFALNSQMGEMMLMVFGMFSRFFISQLREKVLRGMKGAARRKTSVGRPRLGYGLVPVLDAQGRPAVGADGRVTRQKAIHPETMQYVMMAASWFANREKNYSGIAREFSRMKVDGSDAWRSKSIKELLADPVYIGVDIFNKTRNDFDPETHKRTTTRNPHREWQIKLTPELRVWSDELWKKIRRRAYAIDEKRRERKQKLAGAAADKGGGSVAGARNADAPTTLLSGTLFCECGQELKLVRSGKHAAMGCFSGRDGLHGCTMNTVKATAIVEEAVVSYVRQHLLSDAALHRLVDAANAALAEEAAKPRPNAMPLKAELKKLTAQRDKLVGLLLAEDCDQFLQGVKDQIKELEKRMNRLNGTIVEIDRQNEPLPPTLNVQDVLGHLRELREVLGQEPAAAGVTLRKLTGKITVSHQRHKDKKGGIWTLSFAPSLVPVLLERAKDSKAAEAPTLARLQVIDRVDLAPTRLVVDKRLSINERIASDVAALKAQIDPDTDEPFTIPAIATRLGYSVDVTYKAWTTARQRGRDACVATPASFAAAAV